MALIRYTRGDALRACPWLSYFAPSALRFVCPPLALPPFRAFGAAFRLPAFGATIVSRLRRCVSFARLWRYHRFAPLALEVEFRDELHLARGADGVSKNLTKGASGQDQVCIGHRERWSVGYVLRLHADFQVSRFIKPEALA